MPWRREPARVGGILLLVAIVGVAGALAAFPSYGLRRAQFPLDFPDVIAVRRLHALALLAMLVAGLAASAAALALRRAARAAEIPRANATLALLCGGVGLLLAAGTGVPVVLASIATSALPPDSWHENGEAVAPLAAVHQVTFLVPGLGGLLAGLVAVVWMLSRAGVLRPWLVPLALVAPALGLVALAVAPGVTIFVWLAFALAPLLGLPALGGWLAWRGSLRSVA